ncbi:MAG: hypothetical protein AB7I68_03960 [Porticoccaceae bacterium]
MGRPRKTLPRGALEIIKHCASHGLKDSDIARELGLPLRTWLAIKRNNPTARQVWEEGLAAEHDKLYGVLYAEAVLGNLDACKFLLRTRHSYRENAPAAGESGASVQVVLSIPSAMSADQYQKLALDARPLPAEPALLAESHVALEKG